MAYTLNRRLAQLVDSNGQLNTGKIPNDYITSDHVADNTITSAMLHTSFTVSTSNLTAIDTDDVSEGTSNLYYTDARARGAVSATGSLSYNSSTGAFSFTQGDTDTVSEGSTNLYFTNARADARIAAATTDDLTEGSTNLYFTNARVDSRLSGGTGVTYSSGEISIGQDVGTSATPTFGNITTTGYIAGPATFTIDPAAVGDNTGTVVIAGNLQVDGTTTTINSTTVNVDDLNIQLATGAANAAAADGAGITVDGASATITYDGTNNRWDFNKSIEIGSGYGGTPNTDSQLILNDSGNNYITIGSGATSEGGILFADSGDNDVGVISYNHSTDILNVTAPNGIQFNDKLHIVASDPVTNQTLVEFLNTSGYGIYARTNSISARGNTLEFIASDYNNNSAQTHEVLTLRPEGNVGIGTDSPNSPLEIVKNITFTNSDTFPQLLIKTTATTTGNQLGLGVDETDNVAFIEAIDRGTNVIPLVLQRNGGRVGIGIDNPGFALDISNTTSAKINLQGGTNQNGIRFASAGNDGVSSSLYYLGVGSDLMGGTDYGALLLDVTNNRSVLFDDQSTSRLGFYNNSMVINSSGNVGIGETSPLGKLHVKSADSGASADATADELVVEGSGNSGLSILSGASNYGTILFSDSGDSAAGRIRYEHDNNALNFGTNGSWDRFYINSSGNVGINWNGTTARLGIIQSGSSTPGMNITDGGTSDFIVYAGYSTGIARIGPSAGQLAIQTGGTERMRIGSSGNVGIGTINPTQKLEVSPDSDIQAIIGKARIGDLGYDDFAGFGHYDTGVNYAILQYNTGETYVNAGSGRDLNFRINNANVGMFKSDGNFGVGSTNPQTKIHVFGTDPVIRISDDGTSGFATLELRQQNTATEGFEAIYNSGTGHTHLNNVYSAGDLVFATATGSFGTTSTNERMRITSAGKIGTGEITAPAQNFVVGTSTNYDPPGLGNSNANFSILKKNTSASGNYGMITGISSDGNVWSQVQRTDGTATAYNLYLQPDGGSVGIGIPQNYVYIPNLIYPLRVGKVRTGVGNVSDYLTKIAIDAIGYGGSNYQMSAIDFTGGDTAGASGNLYARIGMSSMNGANNQEEGSLEFFVRAPGYSMETAEAMKICGKAGTSIAGSGNSRNGVLFPFQGIAIDRTWANYPGIAVGNSSHYSSNSTTQAEFRFHGANFSSDSYPGTSGSDFSVNVRTDGSFISTSDGRAKTNITTIDNALEKVNQLTGKRFQRINRENEPQEHLSKNGYKFGFIAQEIEDIIPEAVQYHADEDDGTENWNSAYAMDYGSVVALLVNAIKEQDVVIQDLKTRIETLEG